MTKRPIEEEKALSGQAFNPGDPELVTIKKKSHELSAEYSSLAEDNPRRSAILKELLGQWDTGFMQGPIFFHYGIHTRIGKNFFANYDLTIQDDGAVTIGDNVMFGPKTTIVTPNHPLVASERNGVKDARGNQFKPCFANPVTIKDNVWLGASVTICPGVTIGENSVIGAGSVVTKSIPENVVAAGNPCRVIRTITEADRLFQ
ncbi:sugar O-acetyltransferase [uncultured Vagococcus sp.]|uniref:sugar O-acetyltransferase n=1 Tax=uncultured Vagococcus sp. TaxID=189676 RepID=UPI0028D3C03E|nr:sugar O-acetyltransferase [uncultured Vagococcus sp.]